jgi:diacylglycerol O-acyltransferase / wax synthase
MRQLSGTDTMMLVADRPHAQNLIAPVNIYDPSTAPGGAVSFDDVLAYIDARLHISASFRERLVTVPFSLDRPYWIRDPDFDLEYHVRQLALPHPGDWQQFCVQIARLGARPLDMTRPPWELYIIEGLDGIDGVPPGSFAMMLKLHHAAVDGVSGAEMITVLHDPSPDQPREMDLVDDWAPEEPPSTAGLLARAGTNAVVRPVAFVRSVLPQVRSIPGAIGGLRGASPRATRFNAPVSSARVFGAVQFDLGALKRIRTVVPETKINDVALALVGGALRRYLDDKGELPSESLIALMPISLRPTLTQRPTGQDVEAGAGGNRFSMMPIPMATDLASPLARLQAIQQATAAAKSTDAMGAQALTELSEMLPGALMGSVQRAVVRSLNRRGRAAATHTIVTNVPGPQTPVYFCGAKAVVMTGMAPVVDGMGLINGVGSYGGQVPVSFTSDREMMPDPEFYEQCLRDSFGELVELAPPPARPATKVSATKVSATKVSATKASATKVSATKASATKVSASKRAAAPRR